MSLEEDKEITWAILKGDARGIAHLYGPELQALAQRRGKVRFHRRFNELLEFIMQVLPNKIDVCAVIRCWLVTYNLPVDPEKLQNFDLFHENYGHFIAAESQNIPWL
jgi:hypothetical protein